MMSNGDECKEWNVLCQRPFTQNDDKIHSAKYVISTFRRYNQLFRAKTLMFRSNENAINATFVCMLVCAIKMRTFLAIYLLWFLYYSFETVMLLSLQNSGSLRLEIAAITGLDCVQCTA